MVSSILLICMYFFWRGWRMIDPGGVVVLPKMQYKFVPKNSEFRHGSLCCNNRKNIGFIIYSEFCILVFNSNTMSLNESRENNNVHQNLSTNKLFFWCACCYCPFDVQTCSACSEQRLAINSLATKLTPRATLWLTALAGSNSVFLEESKVWDIFGNLEGPCTSLS